MLQRQVQIQVVQHRHHRDQVIVAGHLIEPHAPHRDYGVSGKPLARDPNHLRVRVHGVDVVELSGQSCGKTALAATDVQPVPATRRQPLQNPAMKAVVVAPGVAPVEGIQPHNGTAGKTLPVPDVHDRQRIRDCIMFSEWRRGDLNP